MKIIGVIPARYASTRFPGKPLADICGKPMIWWVYNQAVKVNEFSDVCIATDDEKILSVCKEHKMNAVLTSGKHKTGSDRVGEVAGKIQADIYVNIQGDEPLIEPAAIKSVISIFEDKSVYCGTLKNKISDRELIKSRHTVKVVTDDNDYALYFSRSVIPSDLNNYTGVTAYRHIGIYAYKRDFILKFSSMTQSSLELAEGMEILRAMQIGDKVKVKETEFNSIGVDLPEHIIEVEKILRLKKGNT